MNLEQIGKKLVGSEDERAVSPVIGVVLMVAITVILAAVIAAFVLDMGDMGQEAQAGVEIETNPGDAETQVTWAAEGNAEEIEATLTLEDVDDQSHNEEKTADASEFDGVGSSHTFRVDSDDEWGDLDLTESEMNGDYAEGEIVVTATTSDGTTTVIMSETVEWNAQ